MNKHSPSVLIKKEMLKIWNFPMNRTKNLNTQFEIQIGEKGKSWKTNLWIVAHGGSSLFPSSGELFLFEVVLLRRSVRRWWRFGVKEERKQRNGVNRRSVWRWWRFGVKQEGKQRKWPEPVSVRAGCGGSARRRSLWAWRRLRRKLCACVRAFCFLAVWRFSVKVFCGSLFFLTWRGLIGVA